jgi:hypothetical protein
MKVSFLGVMVTTAFLCVGWGAQAQYKAPSQYFPKNSPAPGGKPATPQAPAQKPPAAPQQPKFKDLPLNTQFYFLSDTNRAYAWMKISAATAKNTKNGLTQAINVETPVQR